MADELSHLYNLDAERALLSCMFLDPGALILASERRVWPDWYYSERHQILHRALMEVAAQDPEARVDIVAVQDWLARHNLLEQVGGMAYVTQVLSCEPSAAMAEHYIRVLRECYLHRRLRRLALEIQAMAQDPEGRADDKIAKAQALFAQLTDAAAHEVMHISEAVERRREDYQRWRQGQVPGVPTGLGVLDAALDGGFQPATLNILAALTSRGKTALALQIALNAARRGLGVLFFSLELTAGEVIDRLLCMSELIPSHDLRWAVRQKWQQVEAGLDKLAGLPLWLDTSGSLTVADVAARVRRLMTRYSLALVVVDYLQYMAVPMQQGYSRNDEIASLTRGLKDLAKATGLPFLVLSQLNRRPELREGRKIAPPRLSDLRDSGAVEQDADTVMFLHRPKFYEPDDNGETDLILAKHRQGPRTTVRLMFRKEYGCFALAGQRDDVPAELG